ncbi:MAG: Gfo/Idh/MocA family oxidoreductase [Planctomycetota bacterium]|nr:Gfo/Idh/MocA family oxidoreductase [Planctomycetota bacterium]
MKRTKIGVIGCGNISGIYCKAGQRFHNLEIVACADLDAARAKAKAEEFKIPNACSVSELLQNPDIEIVLNLTIPKAHAQVTLAALEAGKHAYTEKPLAVTREDGHEILRLAERRKLRVGSAPDTFLGAGLQTCRKLIDDGWIGEPIGATAFFMSHGPEDWHPDPEFVYQPGAGPLFDMGPYYLTALIGLIGPVRRVSGSARVTFPERMITSQPKYGTMMKVNTPTYLAGVLDFANGAIGTLVTTFDVWSAEVPRIEIYGTAGSLSVPDPNSFGGPVRVRRAKADHWAELPLLFPYAENSRGLGVADMASALRSGRPNRASGEMAYHVLDIMHAVLDASQTGRHVQLSSTCMKPAALPLGLRDGEVDE